MRLAFAVLLLFSFEALAASRARYGGTLRVSVVAPSLEQDPLLADTPAEAALVTATTSALCRLDGQGQVVPLLAQELTWTTPTQLHIALRPQLKTASGAPLGSREVLASLGRALQSPYRGLLAPLRARSLPASAQSTTGIDLSLDYPFPDLLRGLCSPVLGVTTARAGARPSGLGPFGSATGSQTYDAQIAHPEGRAFADRLVALVAEERGAARQLALKQAQLVLGSGPLATAKAEPEGDALYSTYLFFQPQRTGPDLRQAVESTLDRMELARIFARQPAVAQQRLLPPALMPQETLLRPGAPRPPAVPRELTLLFDAQVPDQRAVAERLQVKLHDRGYRIVLKALPREALRAKWAAKDYDLMIQALLLPPVPSLALAVVLDAAGRADLLPQELSALGALADPLARDGRARDRANVLAPALSLIPLYAQGLSVQSVPPVQGLTRDRQGLPSLADTFLVPESP